MNDFHFFVNEMTELQLLQFNQTDQVHKEALKEIILFAVNQKFDKLSTR